MSSRTVTWIIVGILGAIFIYWQFTSYSHSARLSSNLGNKYDKAAQVAAASELIDKKELGDTLTTASSYVHYYALDAFTTIAKTDSASTGATAKARGAEALNQIVAMLKYPDEGVRLKAQAELVDLGAIAAPVVAGALADPDPHAKMGAIAVMDRMGAAAVPILVGAVQKTPPQRGPAVEALVPLTPAPEPDMLKLLSDKDKDVRSAAATYFGDTTLVKLTNPADQSKNAQFQAQARDLLLGLLKDKDVRPAAMRAEGLLNDTRSIPEITKALTDPADAPNRRTAIVAFGDMHATAAIPLLIPFLHDDDPDIQSIAVVALHSMGQAAVPGLADAFGKASGKDPVSTSVRRGVVDALSTDSAPEAVALLSRGLQDPDETVRRASALSMAAPGDAAAVAPLIASLRDPSADVAEAAETSLGRIGAPAVGPLVATLGAGADQTSLPSSEGPGGPQPAVVAPYYASQALAAIGRDAAPAVTEAAQNGPLGQRKWALITLASLLDPRAHQVLEQIAATGDPSLRWFAEDALRRYQA